MTRRRVHHPRQLPPRNGRQTALTTLALLRRRHGTMERRDFARRVCRQMPMHFQQTFENPFSMVVSKAIELLVPLQTDLPTLGTCCFCCNKSFLFCSRSDEEFCGTSKVSTYSTSHMVKKIKADIFRVIFTFRARTRVHRILSAASDGPITFC